MKRRIYADLLDWKNRSDRKPLILEGVRQCGKTYILKEFGNREFDSLAYLDLERRKDLRPLFGDDLDPRRIITNIGIALGRRIVPGRTLIVLDEVQTCPRALTAMKYFCEEIPEQHVICAGSLLGIPRAGSESFPVGKVDRLKMYPMSFLEFMEACGEDSLCEMIRSIDPSKGLEEAFRVRIEDCLRQYYVVGGLPDVVSSWVANHNESAVTRKLKNNERDYRDDFAKHAPELLPKLTAVWGSIPMQLGKENRKFMFARVKGSGRREGLSEALQWILDAGLAYRVPMIEDPSTPLKNVCSPSDFKVYLCDVGLMRIVSGRKASFAKSDAQEDRLYKGAMTENHVLCQMMSGGLEEAFYPKMDGYLALHRSSCPSAGRFDHQTGSGWQAHPRFKMFLAALMSRSMMRPQQGQLCTLTLRSFFTTRPHPEHICDVPLGSTSTILRRALAATSAILVRIRPIEASLYWFVILLERDLDLSCSTLRSSMTIPS